MDENVGAGLEGPACLTPTLGMYSNRQPLHMRGMDQCIERRLVEQRATAVQHNLDQVVRMCGRLVDCAYGVPRSFHLPD